MFSTWDTTRPIPFDFFSEMHVRLREISQWWSERFELDHQLGSGTNTLLLTCDGIHKHVTMPPYSGVSTTTGLAITTPELPDGAIMVYRKSDGLYVKNSKGEVKLRS